MGPKNQKTLAPPPWDRGMIDPLETHPPPHITLQNMVDKSNRMPVPQNQDTLWPHPSVWERG